MRERSRVVKNAMNAHTMGFMILDPLGQAKRPSRSLMWFAQAIKKINGYRFSGRTGKKAGAFRVATTAQCNNIVSSSRHPWCAKTRSRECRLQRVLMMQPTQHRPDTHRKRGADPMPGMHR